jgi:hypothetical protein
MIRTKFYNRHNVVSLRIERKRRRLRQRKADRDRFICANKPADRDYRIGLLIRMDQAYLTKADLALCDRLYELEPGDDVTLTDKRKLLRLITRLLPDPKAVVLFSADPDEVNDGSRKRRAA